MPITAADIKLLASQRMTDAADGGGQMTGTPLQDGAENNVWPDISSTDRAFGRLALRKVYPAVLQAGTDTLLGAHVILSDMADEAAIDGFAFKGSSAAQTRAEAVAMLEAQHWVSGGGAVWTWNTARTRIKAPSSSPIPWVGQVLLTTINNGAGTTEFQNVITGITEIPSSDGSFADGFSSSALGDRVFQLELDGVPPSADIDVAYALPGRCVNAPVVSTKPVTGTLAIGDTWCDVDSLLVAIVPRWPGAAAGDAAQTGVQAIDPIGRVAAFRAGDGLVLHHTGTVAAATYANGNTIDCGRTGLASVRVVGSDGVGIAAGWSVNLATGIVTVSDISGWAQPVTVRHTIQEVLSCSRTSYATATQAPLSVGNRIVFNRALTRGFPAGTLVSSMLLLGDLQARAGASWSQEAWTGVWADSRVGGAIAAQYQQAGHPIVVSNLGAANERWAIIFITATTFRVVGETLGQIATGDVNSTCAPLNPATASPYFTIAAAGWGAGWSAGNVLRFNTTGCNAPVWAARVVLPSPPSDAPDAITIAIRGDIDA